MSTALRTYIRGNNLVSMIDHQANQKRVYHFDHQGTTQCLTDATTGAVTDRFAADAWGVQVKRTGTSINRQWYIGSWGYYRGGGNTYVRHRSYTEASGRWVSRDPLAVLRRSLPLYAYCLSRPVRRIDPSGLDCFDCCCCPDSVGGLAARRSVLWDQLSVIGDAQRRSIVEAYLSEYLRRFRHQVGVGPDPSNPIDPVVGHLFEFKLTMRHPATNLQGGKCSLRWFECASSPVFGLIKEPNKWIDLSSVAVDAAGSDQWRAYLADPNPCPGTVVVPMWDRPQTTAWDAVWANPNDAAGTDAFPVRWIPLTGSRQLLILIELRPHPACRESCPPKKLRLHQSIEVVSGIVRRATLSEVGSFPGGDPTPGGGCAFPPTSGPPPPFLEGR